MGGQRSDGFWLEDYQNSKIYLQVKLRNNPVARGPVLSANSERIRDYPSQQNYIRSGDFNMSENQH